MPEKIIHLNEDALKDKLSDLVRGTVEETLNNLLDAEADRIANAARYERSEERRDTRAGHYNRKLLTKAGEVTLKVPKMRHLPFETAIIERYKRRESSIEEALIEMYLAGVSVRRIEDITEALWGTKVSPGTISELNKKVYSHIEAWRARPLAGRYPYVYLDGIFLKRCWGGEIQNVSVLVAIGVNKDGFREILGAAEGMKEDRESWLNFFTWLKGRGLAVDDVGVVHPGKQGMVDAALDVGICLGRRCRGDRRSKQQNGGAEQTEGKAAFHKQHPLRENCWQLPCRCPWPCRLNVPVTPRRGCLLPTIRQDTRSTTVRPGTRPAARGYGPALWRCAACPP